jgi:hypothetical protein
MLSNPLRFLCDLGDLCVSISVFFTFWFRLRAGLRPLRPRRFKKALSLCWCDHRGQFRARRAGPHGFLAWTRPPLFAAVPGPWV